MAANLWLAAPDFFPVLWPYLTLANWSQQYTEFLTDRSRGLRKGAGVCLEQISYALGAWLFWTTIVPASIFILLVFGHELWRRICPLSFLSQIPRALLRQRQHRRVDAKTGKTSYELAKVKKFLGRSQLFIPTVWFILSWFVRSVTLCQLWPFGTGYFFNLHDCVSDRCRLSLRW